MNNLEKSLLAGGVDAQKRYGEMTGWWLSHGPESFIEHEIALKVSKEGFYVFPECSPKKIMEEKDKRPRGRPSGNRGQRFDIVVWHKATNSVRAIIEIKRAWNVDVLRADSIKVKKALGQNLAKSGYLVIYTEAKGKKASDSLSESEKAKRRADTLTVRLNNWAMLWDAN